MNNIVFNLAIGALGSIIASVVLYLLSKLYNFDSTKQRLYYIDLALNYIFQIENRKDFPEDYDFVIHCVEQLHSQIFEIHKTIYPLTMFFSPKKKRLVETLLFDISRRCELCLFLTIGYDEQKEKEARLTNLQTYFYSEESKENNCSIIRLAISLIKQLLRESIYKAFTKVQFLPYEFKNYEELVEVNSFKHLEIENNYMQVCGVTKKEYKKIIEKLNQSQS
mgnify:CR=1 FL=1